MASHRTLRLSPIRKSDRPIRFSLGQLFLWLTVLATLLGVSLWLASWPSLVISGDKISLSQTLRVTSSSDRFVDGLSLVVSGTIDGQATIQLDDRSIYSIGPGKFKLDISPHEYYDSEAEIHYTPQNVTKGKVRIRYNFHTVL